MTKKATFTIKLRQQETGEEHDRLIFAQDEATACARAIARARIARGKTMAERQYAVFEVVSVNRSNV